MEEATQIIRMHSRFTIAILEDNRAREQAMKTAVDTALPDAVCFFFDSAHAMIEWLRDWLGFSAASPPAMISLDHDLDFLPGPDGQRVDPGDGRDVVKFLAMRKPFCPVIVHTSNGLGAASMVCNLEEAGWKVTRVQPENDVGWVKLHWAVCAVRLVYEWEKLHSKVSP
jgi:hypothetical protein